MSEISKQIMATPAHLNLFSDEPLVSGSSLTTINSNLAVPFSSLDEDEATHIPQKLDNSAYPEKSPCLIDGHDDDDDDDDDDEHGDGSNEWRGGDVTAEYDGSKEDSHGLVRCSSVASITSNYIHSMGESSKSAPGQNMDHTGVEEVWSNGKHNAHLDSMEENFVRDMYAHDYCYLELCANQPRSQSESESEASVVYTGTSSDIMDELSESESSVVYSSTIIDEMMSSEDAPQCMETTISSASSFLRIRGKGGINCINNAKKEKADAHATTSTTESTSTTRNKKRKRTTLPTFANSGPSNWQNVVQQHLLEIDIARLHKHATNLTNLVQDSGPTIDSNVKKRACPVESHEEESSMKTLQLLGKKHLFLSGSYDQVVPNPCINSTGSHQDMQYLAKITRAEAIDLGSTTKPPS